MSKIIKVDDLSGILAVSENANSNLLFATAIIGQDMSFLGEVEMTNHDDSKKTIIEVYDAVFAAVNSAVLDVKIIEKAGVDCTILRERIQKIYDQMVAHSKDRAALHDEDYLLPDIT